MISASDTPRITCRRPTRGRLHECGVGCMNRFSLTKPRLEFDEGSALVNESNACAVEGTDEVVPNQTRGRCERRRKEGRERRPTHVAHPGHTQEVEKPGLSVSLTWYHSPVTVESRVKLGSAGGKY